MSATLPDEISLEAARYVVAEIERHYFGGNAQLQAAIQCAVNRAIAAEREACAAACHSIAMDQRRHRLTGDGALLCRDAIQARGGAQ